MARIEHQLSLNLDKPRDATPEEVQEWWDTELKKQGDSALKWVIFATITQLLSLGFMGLMMLIIQTIVK